MLLFIVEFNAFSVKLVIVSDGVLYRVSAMPLDANVDRKQRVGQARATLHAITAPIKVLLVTVGSIAAVIFASLIITIIEFQLRLSEARTQNGNITLESVQLIADYQDNISNHYKQMRVQADQLNGLRTDYLSKLNSTTQIIMNLCGTLAPQKVDDCYLRLQTLINNNSNQIDAAISEFNPDAAHFQNGPIPVYVADLKKIITSGSLQTAQSKYLSTKISFSPNARH